MILFILVIDTKLEKKLNYLSKVKKYELLLEFIFFYSFYGMNSKKKIENIVRIYESN